ncbi:MAG TPA: hypothetical protein VGU25_13135 [Acidobacteriaceae bacterium]|nr:hypothetical protein [Acidobacteriaceae bacterium]
MKTSELLRNARLCAASHHCPRPLAIFSTLLVLSAPFVNAQTDQSTIPAQIQQLTAAMERTQVQLKESQRQLDDMRQQLANLQQQMASQQGTATPAADPPQTAALPQDTSAELEAIREHQAAQDAQIATHDQTKVESESKYPVKITGLLLFNAFTNTSAVDIAATPTVALPGSGNTGASVRQTILGIDARGPHLFGARSYADLRVDFFGNSTPNTTFGSYSTNDSFLRLRTAHAGLQWDNTEAGFSYDRPILSPDTPSSLTAVATPSLAWSGNLWAWNPQLTVTQNVPFADSRALQLQAALIDVADPPVSLSGLYSAAAAPPSSAQQSRWPGLEARIAALGPVRDDRDHIGVGGYFSPHVLPSGRRFDAWAATLDTRFHLPGRLEFSGSFYRGLALGGLGAGAYKDYGYIYSSVQDQYYFRPLNDVGGWTQLKEKWNERLEFNASFGIDNGFASDLHRYANPSGAIYQNLARNRTWTGNIIYSPSAYLLFSFEYRYLASAPVIGLSSNANVIGLSAGYKF